MNTQEVSSSAEQEQAAAAAALKKWWDSLTAKAQKALVRRAGRRAERKRARVELRAAGHSGYCCPKCHTWLATPEERKVCRESHWKKEEVTA